MQVLIKCSLKLFPDCSFVFKIMSHKVLQNLLSQKSILNRILAGAQLQKGVASFFQFSKCHSLQQSNSSADSAIPANKDDVLTDYVNRNPRNLEMLRIARQPQGHILDQSLTRYWYCLELVLSGKHTLGRVRHHSGKVVLSASTSEFAIKSRLQSTIDHNAAMAIAEVLARRCLEAGITEMSTKLHAVAEGSEKTKAFLAAMEKKGVRLQEDFQIHEIDMYRWSREKPTLPWDVTEDNLKTRETIERNLKPKQ